jgi:hypothetical protein
MNHEENQYLAHHGVTGMKKGIRRFQYEDGSLTEEGRIHYGIGQGGNRKYNRLFSRQMSKLKRFNDNANVNLQMAKAEEYSAKSRIDSKSKLFSYGLPSFVRLPMNAYLSTNKARAAIARHRTTEKGHAKAVQKAKEQYAKMVKTFADTPYENLIKGMIKV